MSTEAKATTRKYTYLISFCTTTGAFGTVPVSFPAPLSSQDRPEMDRFLENHHPGAVLLGFSLFAPDRVDGKVNPPVLASDLLDVVRHLEKANARIADLERRLEGLGA